MIARSKQAVRAAAGMYLALPRSELPESGPCSRFLPCSFTRMGLPTLEENLRIVAKTLEPDASVGAVAARHDVYLSYR